MMSFDRPVEMSPLRSYLSAVDCGQSHTPSSALSAE